MKVESVLQCWQAGGKTHHSFVHSLTAMTSQGQRNEVEETINELRKQSGFKSYLILNGDGIVINSSLPHGEAVQLSAHILQLYKSSKECIGDLCGYDEESTVESVRLRTKGHELIAAQHGKYMLVVMQDATAKAKEVVHEAEL